MAFTPGGDGFIPGGDHANLCLAWNKSVSAWRKLGCSRTPRRKRRIRENQSTATVPINLQFRSYWTGTFVCMPVLRVCSGRAGGFNKSADWLITLPYSLSLHCTLIWPSNVVYFSGTGEFSDLRRPPAEISVLSFFRRACENSL